MHTERAYAGDSGIDLTSGGSDFVQLDRQVARARTALSLVAIISLYIDPSAGGLFHLEAALLATLGCHLAYSLLAYLALTRGPQNHSLQTLSTVLDLTFATAIAFQTEGATSPSFVFFVFAIMAAGFRAAPRNSLRITVYSVSLYVAVTAFSQGHPAVYGMRAVYLAIAGYLIGFFGQQRARFEIRLRELESAMERLRIARSLHDGYIQALAGINLRLETCRDMLLNNQTDEGLAEIQEIQTIVEREYDQVRDYVRFLAKADQSTGAEVLPAGETEFRISAAFTARANTVEHVMHILLESVRNVQLHARARSSTIAVDQPGKTIRLKVDDDGIGFGDTNVPPWTIASRVAELKGRLTVRTNVPSGAHIDVEIPAES